MNSHASLALDLSLLAMEAPRTAPAQGALQPTLPAPQRLQRPADAEARRGAVVIDPYAQDDGRVDYVCAEGRDWMEIRAER